MRVDYQFFIQHRIPSVGAFVGAVLFVAGLTTVYSGQSIATTERLTDRTSTETTSTALMAGKSSAHEVAALYPPGGINFTIYRDDRRVGKHSVRFESDGDELMVSIDSRIRITILKVPVFTLRYTASERWDGDQLIFAKATTRENRNSSTVSLRSAGEQSELSTLTGTRQVERLGYASNHWNANVLEADRFFNTLTGEASDIRINRLGKETVATTSGSREATRYRVEGDVTTEIWYDSMGRWVAFAFDADDGSRIRYQLID